MVWLILTQILVETQNKLRESQWNLTVLIDKDKREGVPDDFDCFVMTTRAIPDDVAELASYIYTHSQVGLSPEYSCINYHFRIYSARSHQQVPASLT